MARKRRDPFEVSLSEEQERKLVTFLSTEITNALMVRDSLIGDAGEIDYWHKLYEGGDRTIVKNTPWPDAANLTSHIGTEKVDALRSRILKHIFVEPVCVVEGWGKSASRAPFVEEFHQWKQEEERLQGKLGKAIHNSLIETVGVLEVYEYAERRKVRREMEILVATNELGGPMLDEKGEPVLLRNEDGDLVPADETSDRPTARVIVDGFVTEKRGPRYRIIPVRDFLMLPGHAMDQDQLWGYAKRFWRRVPELLDRQEQRYYKNVELLGRHGEREETPRDQRSGQGIAPQYDETAEKPLWEIPFKYDLDEDDIEEWYVATLSVESRVLLRLQRDDIGRSRYIVIIPFPRPDSVWGYSYIGNKLINIIEEHTALGNQITDRSTLVNAAPIKRVQGALWDPQEQPFGPRAVIDVRDLREVEAMTIPDVPRSMIERESTILRKAEGVSGMTDTAVGLHPIEDRTLGENQLVAGASFVRIDEVIHNVQESVEDLYELRHIIWQRALQDQDEEAPQGVMQALATRGSPLQDGKFTAQLLRGHFKFKPWGSVETADLNRARVDLRGFMETWAGLIKALGPQSLFAQRFMDPRVQRELMAQIARVYRFPNRHALLGEEPGTQQLMEATEGAMDGEREIDGAGGPGGAAGAPGLEAILAALSGGMGAGNLQDEGAGGPGPGG